MFKKKKHKKKCKYIFKKKNPVLYKYTFYMLRKVIQLIQQVLFSKDSKICYT